MRRKKFWRLFWIAVVLFIVPQLIVDWKGGGFQFWIGAAVVGLAMLILIWISYHSLLKKGAGLYD